jgi:hypothetical protein
MKRKLSRRKFVQLASATAGAAAFSFPVPTIARGRLEKPTVLGIGAGGKGRADLAGAVKAGFDVIALADVVDEKKLGSFKDQRIKSMMQVRDAYPQAQFGTDYREMIADLGGKVDAVIVSTPDHHHFHAGIQAMEAGKHVDCQKPLTHGIWEARMMAQVAAETGVKTQMGNQAHANDHVRRCVELIRAGVVGKVKEIHTWTNRPIWAQGFASPPPAKKVPAAIDWKQWIGPTPWVDYNPAIAPFAWRGWWDYGTGALGRHGLPHHGSGILVHQSRPAAKRDGRTKWGDEIFAANQFQNHLEVWPQRVQCEKRFQYQLVRRDSGDIAAQRITLWPGRLNDRIDFARRVGPARAG